jgi:hypothetical protein
MSSFDIKNIESERHPRGGHIRGRVGVILEITMDKAVVVLVFLIPGYQYFVDILVHFCRKSERILGLWVCKVFF